MWSQAEHPPQPWGTCSKASATHHALKTNIFSSATHPRFYIRSAAGIEKEVHSSFWQFGFSSRPNII
jgi:hypothetical protein